MLPSWLQQFDTLQQYLRCLFDCECLNIERLRSSEEPVVEQAVRMLTTYGRKIMELSEQATFQHRNQHYLGRRQVQQELMAAFRAIVGEQVQPTNYEQMIKAINERLQEERKSIWNKLSMPESRVIEKIERQSRVQERSSLKEEERNLRQSKGKSRVSKNGAVKQALQIKGYLDGEEDAIRDFFIKLNKMLETHKVPVGNLDQEALKFTRISQQNSSDRISDLVRTSTEAHTRNINNLCTLVELLHESLQRRLKNEGQAQGRLAVFLEEVQRMEEVYSYTLSKMLERLAQVKDSLPQETSAGRHLESLEEITRKLYTLYPTQEIMQSLAARGRQEGKNYGVQVSIGKLQQDRRVSGEAFRLQTRVGECLERFERASKHRKTFDLKEIEKLMETIRQVLPVREAKGEAEAAYKQEFKGLIELQEKREKQAVDSLGKKLKKTEKRVLELEAAVEQLKRQGVIASQEWEQERKKLSKRADGEQSELKKLAKQKAALDANLSQYIQDIDRMRQEVRRQGEEEAKLRRSLEREVNELRDECQAAKKRLKAANEESRMEREQISEERTLYRQKIQMTEGKLEQQKELSAGLRVQLEAALSQHREARNQLSQMSRIYEEKIRELDEVIQHLRELQQIKLAQESAIQELQTQAHELKNQLQATQKALLDEQSKVRQLLEERKDLLGQVEHWKQQGGLTDSDLKQLREEVQKVSRAYLESEEHLDAVRRELTCTNEEREKLMRERLRLNRLVEDLETQAGALKTKLQANQLSERDLRDEYYQAAQDSKRLQREVEDLRKDITRTRKQLQEQREERTKCERELRELRQEQQGRKQNESAEQGRRRLEIENLRIELRRKTEQAEKQQAAYEEKLSMAHQKMKELEEFAGQKHLLSRLMHNHQTQ